MECNSVAAAASPVRCCRERRLQWAHRETAGFDVGDPYFGATCGHIIWAIPEGSLELSGHQQPLGEQQ